MFWLRNKKNNFQFCTLTKGMDTFKKSLVKYLINDCSARQSDKVIEVTPLWGPAALTFTCTVSALAIQARNTSRIQGLCGSKLASPSSRLAILTILYSTGGRAGTDRMLARAAGFTSGSTLLNTDTT